ncbi:SDR family oxidoreductase [Endozoicomonas sp. Mp262]|uniref:SDR family oxidoreductase n=1 Tax=Endozoicomonas sp. Mp262 TaxID=2919499 RepID=UPI0021DAB6AB
MSKAVLVTGANRGIGLEFCKQYLSLGYKVYACCRSPESSPELLTLKQKVADRLHVFPLDVTNEGMLKALPHMLEGQPIDILINNAGVYGPKALPFGQIDDAEWLNVMKVNTIAPLQLAQLLVDNVAASQERKVVLLTSKMGSISDNTSGGSYIYRSSKAALNAVGKSLSVDLAPKGIKVALVHPGWVKTDMGGNNALIDTETSVSGLCRVIEQLSEENSGQFFNYDGALISW